MKTWLKPQITESEAGMEVTSYLPAEFSFGRGRRSDYRSIAARLILFSCS